MLHLMLCDDDPFFMALASDIITQLIKEEKLAAEVACMARSMQEAVAYLQKNGGETLIFLDLDFGAGNLNGIDMAAALRKIEPDVRIVFTTNHHEMALHVLKSGTEPFGFLEKTADILKLRDGYRRYIRMAIQTARAKKTPSTETEERFSLSLIGGDLVQLYVNDVVFVETEKNVSHGITFHTINGSRLTTLGTMDEVERQLGRGFLRVHRSYLVNLSQVLGLKDGYLRLSTQDEVPCSFQKRKLFI